VHQTVGHSQAARAGREAESKARREKRAATRVVKPLPLYIPCWVRWFLGSTCYEHPCSLSSDEAFLKAVP
jgi:hypothetical protein